jgi:hypothetical protein
VISTFTSSEETAGSRAGAAAVVVVGAVDDVALDVEVATDDDVVVGATFELLPLEQAATRASVSAAAVLRHRITAP